MRVSPRKSLALLLLTLGCGREIAQTASRDPDATAALETSCEEPLVELPAAPPWVSGELVETPLIATNYSAGEGPGLFITARDAYRVYLNGAPIHQSRAPRSADFVPLTLLPGENRLAIAVWAASGTPAALLQLDELTESHVSDENWRVELSPPPDFSTVNHDDGTGEPASSYGRLGSLPGCDPSTPFPQASLSHWIGPRADAGASVVLHRNIRVVPVGFGENADGGDGSSPSVATTFEELDRLASDPDTPAVIVIPEGDYDYRRRGDELTERLACPGACSEDATKVRYRLLSSGETCAAPQVTMQMDQRVLRVGSNKTIVGLGRGAHLRGLSLEFGARQNIIVRNLAVYDVNRSLQEGGDAIGMRGTNDVWLDHITTKWIGDGLTDISAGTQRVTLSWMHYDGANPADCRGRHTHASTITGANVTIHHSFFEHADSHAPLVEDAQARVHVFNNFVQDNDGYGVGAACGAQVLLQGTTFRSVLSPTSRRECDDVAVASLISALAGSNLYLQDVGDHTGGDGQEPNDTVFEPAYEYSVDPAAQNWQRVLERAGAGGAWRRSLSIEP
jgi:pectate lyase